MRKPGAADKTRSQARQCQISTHSHEWGPCSTATLSKRRQGFGISSPVLVLRWLLGQPGAPAHDRMRTERLWRVIGRTKIFVGGTHQGRMGCRPDDGIVVC